jgi:hypothetical protein
MFNFVNLNSSEKQDFENFRINHLSKFLKETNATDGRDFEDKFTIERKNNNWYFYEKNRNIFYSDFYSSEKVMRAIFSFIVRGWKKL